MTGVVEVRKLVLEVHQEQPEEVEVRRLALEIHQKQAGEGEIHQREHRTGRGSAKGYWSEMVRRERSLGSAELR